jgi:class 3 adenylate cyclase/DNA-binding CsgD family transcriptional regulator
MEAPPGYLEGTAPMSEERKLVTILFADVTESTALGEILDPEDVRTLMGRYYAHARRIIPSHGGTLEKFIGDAVMAVSGLPYAHGDDAERALAAALALREAVATDTLLGERLLLRMGVNTGEVVTTSDLSVSGDFLVTGDVVNISARLQQAASPGEIVAGERTAAASQAVFVFEEPRQVEVKGKSQPVRIFPLREARVMRQVSRPPLVGRRQDLLQLDLLRARALEEQRPQLISIVAPAGAGKTRLLEEFLARLDPAHGFQVAIARCLPYGQTLAYWPLRGLLTELVGEESNRSMLIDTFVGAEHSPEDAARMADLVLTTLGIEHGGIIDRESIFAAWRLLIEAFASQAPRVIVFEDLHWASDSLLDLVEQIIQLRTHAPLMLIALSRPEFLDRRPTWGGGRQNFTALALAPLTADQTRELVGQLLVGRLAATREHIVERCGGNPFFALELVRGLGGHGPGGDAATANALPDTVHAAILARLDLLSPQERAVVQVASVAGRAFRQATLQAILADREASEIDAALDGLLLRDLIMPAERGTFTFRHALIRDVAYGTLTRTERIHLHAKMATWLESFAADRLDEFTELIAYHYRAVIRLSRQVVVSGEMPIERSRAARFLRRAGELASRSCAFAEAHSYLQSAIEIAPEQEHVQLYELLGESVHGDTAVNAYRRAYELWRQAGGENPLVGARLLRKMLIICAREFVSALPSLEELDRLRAEAHRLAEAAGDIEETWQMRVVDLFWFSMISSISAEEADRRRADGLAAAEYFEQRHDWSSLSVTLDAYASFSTLVGADGDALEAAKRRLAIPALPAGERGDTINTLINTSYRFGDYAGCIATLQEALAQPRADETLVYLGGGISLAALAAFVSGRWAELSHLVPILERVWEQVQYDPGTAFAASLGYFALLQLALAQEDGTAVEAASSVLYRIFPESQSELQSVLDAYCEDDVRKLDVSSPEKGLARVLLGSLNEQDIGPLTFRVNIEMLAVAILMLCNEHGTRLPEAFVAPLLSQPTQDMLIWCGQIARALTNEDNARLATAIEEAEKHGLVVHAAHMRVVLAGCTGDRSQLERAWPILQQLGDRRFLHRLEEVTVELGCAQGPFPWVVQKMNDTAAAEGLLTTPPLALSEGAASEDTSPAYPNGLTHREVEVLRLLTTGMSNAQMAEHLVISSRTVNAHLRSIYNKLGVTTRTAATRFAYEHHLAPSDLPELT